MAGQVVRIRTKKGAAAGASAHAPAPRLVLPGLVEIPAAELKECSRRWRIVNAAMAAPRGRRVQTVRSLAKRFHVAFRTVYSWRSKYLKAGLVGLLRMRRSDRGKPRKGGGLTLLAAAAEAALRIRRTGDLAREWRASSLPVSYETFRTWVHELQRRFKFTAPRKPGEGGDTHGGR
jgi:transposase